MPHREKVCLLTGATGGIGRALARELALDGYQLLLSARNEERLAEIRDELPAGSVVDTIAADMLRPADINRVVLASCRVGVDTLVNLSGVNELAMFEEQDPDAISRMVALNLCAPLQLAHGLLPHFHDLGRGLIVNVGSVFGAIGYPGYATYCASKFGLRGFSEALRRELRDDSVDVLYVAPRAVVTDMNSPAAAALNDELGNKSDTPEWVASQIVKAMHRRTSAVALGWPEKLFSRLNQFLPSLVDPTLAKQLPIIRRYARQGR